MSIGLLVLLCGPAEAAPDAAALSEAGRVDESVALLASQLPGSQRELTAVLLTTSPRLAWVPLAESLAAYSDAPAISAWIAAARMRDPAQRVAALASLKTLSSRWPDERHVRRYAAEGYLLAGQAEQAAFLDPERVVASCREPRTAPDCATRWDEAGEVEIAEAVLEASLTAVSRSERARILVDLARVERRLGRDGEAADHLQAALEILPGDPAISSQLLDARLAISQVDAARALLPDTTGAAARQVEAIGRLIGADPATDEAAVLAAWTLAPEHPRVIAARAHWLLASGSAEEAMEILAPALARYGAREPLLSLYTWGAAISGQPERAEEALRAGLRVARDAASWSSRLEELSRFMMIAAEADKAAGRGESAIERYQLAAALTHDHAAALTGLAGALWAAGDLRGAERAYARAAQASPDQPDILLARIHLLQSLDALEEARMLIIQSGQSDPGIRALEQELEIGIRARPAREAAAAGRVEEAAERYRRLELDYPGSPLLLHELADVLLRSARYEEAAVTYARAQRAAPDDPWLRLGEVSARINLGELAAARSILSALSAGGDLRVEAAIRDASVSLRRGEAAAAMAAGRDEEALGIYAELYAETPSDPWTLLGIAGLYGRDLQPDLAYAFYQAAWLQDPTDPALQRGRISALISMGQLEDARLAAAALVASHPSEEHILLVRSIDRAQFLRRVRDAVAIGRIELAEEQLLTRLAAQPDDTDSRALYAELLLARGEAEAAMEQALLVLDAQPDSPAALGVLRIAGASLSRSAEVRDRFITADADWTRAELPLLELTVTTESVVALSSSGRHRDAVAGLEDAQRRQGNAEPRRWVILGSAWLALSEPTRAQGAFEVALSLAPGDPDAVRGLAGALQAQGRGRDALALVTAQWRATRDPRIGTELAGLHRQLGHRAEAAALDAEIAAQPAVQTHHRLPRLDPPPGQPVPEPPEAVASLSLPDAAAQPISRVGWDVGAGQIGRPGEVGVQQLTARFSALAAEVRTDGPLTLGAEVVPLQVSDGETITSGTALSGLVMLGGDALTASARLGTTPLGFFDTPRLMWRGALSGSISGDFIAELETARAPITDSTTSWLSGVTDTWVGGQLIYAPEAELGLLGRFGEATGGDIGTLPWEQALVWGLWPIQTQDQLTLKAWVEGMAMLHDRQIDGFDAGQAGVFSPRGYYAAAGRLVGDWRSEDDRLGACGVVGLGPQYILGEETLYLGPGTWLGYSLEAEVSMRVTEVISARAGYHIDGTWGRWYQSLALLQIGTGAASPGPTVSSMAHGPPLVEPRACLGRQP